jgi:cephalosporin hydroxylase
MEDRIYKMHEIPLETPIMLKDAIRKNLNQQILLDYLGLQEKLPYAKINSVINMAIETGIVKVVKTYVETKGIIRLVNLEKFLVEFDVFLRKIITNEIAISKTDVLKVINHGQFCLLNFINRAKSLLSYKMLEKQMLSYFASQKNLRWFAECYAGSNLAKYVQIASHSIFKPAQIENEILELLNVIHIKRPKKILEIGTHRGGTLYLFSKIMPQDAIIISVDLHISNKPLLLSFAKKKQKIILIEGDSTNPSIKKNVQKIIAGEIDFLFLDGDHSYKGIQKDFNAFMPLVKSNGIVAFHDIVPDNETRYGISTGGWAGDVPMFWKEVKANYEHKEIVNNWQQDGHGIGVLFLSYDNKLTSKVLLK